MEPLIFGRVSNRDGIPANPRYSELDITLDSGEELPRFGETDPNTGEVLHRWTAADAALFIDNSPRFDNRGQWTIAISEIASADTALLLHFDNINDQSVYIDHTQTPKVVNPFGTQTPRQQTVVSRFGGSVELDGVDQYLEIDV